MPEPEPTTERTADTEDSKAERVLVVRGILPGDDTVHPLRGDEITMGRGEESQLRLNFPGVSRFHAVIQRRGPLYTLRDLGSKNGTHIDGRRIEHAPLAPDVVVRMGDWLGIVEDVPANGQIQRFAELAPGTWGGAVLADAFAPLKRAGASTVPVLLVGRTGSGKERFARAVHDLSGRSGPFYPVNCAALPAELLEHPGQMRAASGGTLFLDEVSELPLPAQAKLLRVLETREVTTLGEGGSSRVDFRLVAACLEPLRELVAAGRCRQDFAARIAGLTVTLPELSDRVSDIPSLFARLLREHSGNTAPPVSTKLYESLCLHDWPANVRELEQLARQLLATHGLEPRLRRSFLPQPLREPRGATSSEPLDDADRNERDLERLRTTLRLAGGNVRKAAKIAGISRQRAYRLIGSRRLGNLVTAIREDWGDGNDGRSG